MPTQLQEWLEFLSAPGFTAQAVRAHPDYDSIFIVYNGHLSSNPHMERLGIADPVTCGLVGIWIEPLGFSFATQLDYVDSRYQREKNFLEKAAADRGVPTIGLVKKESTNPRWAAQWWALNNRSIIPRWASQKWAIANPTKTKEDAMSLKLQWYPMDSKEDLAKQTTWKYKQFMIWINYGDRSIRICDFQKNKWTTLFVANGYKEGFLVADGSREGLTLQGLNINVSNWKADGQNQS